MGNGEPGAEIPEPRDRDAADAADDAVPDTTRSSDATSSAPGRFDALRSSTAPRDLRVGDADRTAALHALDRHLEDGRLTVGEYGDRSADAATAVTRSDLERLFVDLPAPHPPLPSAHDATTVVPEIRRADHELRHPTPGVMMAFGAGLMVLLAVLPALAIAGVGFHGGGLVMLPLLFLMIGGFGRHGRHGGHGGPGGHRRGPHH